MPEVHFQRGKMGMARLKVARQRNEFPALIQPPEHYSFRCASAIAAFVSMPWRKVVDGGLYTRVKSG